MSSHLTKRASAARKDFSAAEFWRRIEAEGFAYVRETGGFLDLRRDKRKRSRRLLGVRDKRGRLKRRETLVALLDARMA
jgi:hypothetical protein